MTVGDARQFVQVSGRSVVENVRGPGGADQVGSCRGARAADDDGSGGVGELGVGIRLESRLTMKEIKPRP